MVPITGRAHSLYFRSFQQIIIERRGDRTTVDTYVSEYRKRDLMAQELFLELLIPSYSMIFEL